MSNEKHESRVINLLAIEREPTQSLDTDTIILLMHSPQHIVSDELY